MQEEYCSFCICFRALFKIIISSITNITHKQYQKEYQAIIAENKWLKERLEETEKVMSELHAFKSAMKNEQIIAKARE